MRISNPKTILTRSRWLGGLTITAAVLTLAVAAWALGAAQLA